MLPTVINGLPAHILLIHVVIVLIPLGALFTVLSALWPAARRKLGFISPLTCLIALAFVPVVTHAGEWYRNYLRKLTGQKNAAIDKHADLGHTFLLFAAGLFLVSTAVWWLGRKNDAASEPATQLPTSSGGSTALATRTATAIPTLLTYAVAALSIAMSIVAVWQLYRIGDSGAHAAYGTVK